MKPVIHVIFLDGDTNKKCLSSKTRTSELKKGLGKLLIIECQGQIKTMSKNNHVARQKALSN